MVLFWAWQENIQIIKCWTVLKACMYRKCAFNPMWATSQLLLINKIIYLNKFVCSPLSEWWRRNTFGNNKLHMLASTLIYLIEQLVWLIGCSQQQQYLYVKTSAACRKLPTTTHGATERLAEPLCADVSSKPQQSLEHHEEEQCGKRAGLQLTSGCASHRKALW